MTAARRLAAGGLTIVALALTSLPAYAATKRPAPTPRPPTPVRAKPTVLPPQIYQVTPAKVNPSTQPNIMILGQHLTAASTVQVGGRPATTVQATDTYHMLVKLPDNLAQGSYSIEVTNEAGTTTASDQLVVDDPGLQPTNMMYLGGAGLLILLVLVMRLARTPGLA
ncbi:MAG TPA: IPT/TIG domain-containing protein [Candidatus Dormibacteraeota bacterium]